MAEHLYEDRNGTKYQVLDEPVESRPSVEEQHVQALRSIAGALQWLGFVAFLWFWVWAFST